jgi:hypothetical protein
MSRTYIREAIDCPKQSVSDVRIVPQVSDTFVQLFQKIVSYAGELRNHRIPDEEIDGTRQLAGPFSRGGLLILLIEPREHHPWQAGIHRVILQCLTLRALEEGVRIGSNEALSLIDDVSVLDLRPFIWSGLRNRLQEDQLIQLYGLVFEAIRAKRPDTILCMGKVSFSPYFERIESLTAIGAKKGT